MKRAIILLGITLSVICTARAQLSGAVSVEGEFDPLVIDAERIGEYPLAYRFELPAINLRYDADGKSTDFAPSLLAMGVTGWQTRRPGRLPRGYVDFRLGSFLNSRLDAGVWILRDSIQSLSADLNFHSTSLYRTHGVPADYSEPSRREFYDGRIGVNYDRLIGSEGVLSSRIDYRLGYFNYYGCTSFNGLADNQPRVPTQTVNQFNVTAGYSSSPSLLRGWHASIAAGNLSYRRFVYPDYSAGQQTKGDSETTLGLRGGYSFSLTDNSALAIDADADLLFYAERRYDLPGFRDDWRKDYGIITLTPAYRFETSQVKLQAGLDVDITFSAMGGRNGKEFGAVHFAPDVKLDYRTRQVGFYISATGGVTPVSLAGMERFDPYQMPLCINTCPVYSPIDASLGVNAGPFYGFSADFSLRFAMANGIPLGGWYQALLGTYEGNFSPYKYYGKPTVVSGVEYGERVNLRGLSLRLDLRYKLEGVFDASVKGDFTPQHGRMGIFNGYDRPRFVIDATVGGYPVKSLRVEAGYSLRALRAIYLMTSGLYGEERLASMRLPNISLLQAKISYRLFDTFDLYILGENLLNRRVDILPGLQTNGVALSGGLYWEF